MYWIIPLAIIAAYWLVSLLACLFPCWRCGLPRNLSSLLQQSAILHISHRGGSAQALENTMSAFRNAVKEGSQILELDVYLTADGQIIVHHDANCSRVFGSPKAVEQTTTPELQGLRPLPSVSLHFVQGSYYPTEPERELGPPLLEEVFESFPETFLNIELKTESREAAKEVSRLIDRFGRQEWTIWGVKSSEVAAYMKELQPSVPLFFTPRSGLLTFLGCLCGFLPFIKFDQEVIQFPLPSPLVLRWIPRAIYDQSCLLKCLGLCLPCIRCCFGCIFWHLKRRGHPVLLWTVNEEDEFEEGVRLQADGLMTDRPSQLARFIASRH